MSDLAERIRELKAMQANAGTDLHAVSGVIELAGVTLLHNAPTILAGLAALEADPSAEIARLRAEVERLEREVAERADEAESDHRGILRLGGEIDCLKADNKILRADVERLRGLLEKIRSPVERMRPSVMQAWPNVVYVDIRIAGHDFKDIADFLAGLEQPCKP